jgi:Ser/Thr protein kinase RdoA (MazF antagonist)
LEQLAINAFSNSLRQEILEELELDKTKVIDLGGFESFVFSVEDKILRVTHDSHRTSGQIEAELEFIQHLSLGGASVCLPNKLPSGALLKQFGEFTACLFDRAKGKPLARQDWTPSTIREWGRCIGSFHRLTQLFKPQARRDSWETDSNHDFSTRIPSDQIQIINMAENLLKELQSLPVNKEVYGLIHGDAHAGNFFKHGETLTFFDFDDSIYMWFAYDIATVLFGAVLAQHIDGSREAQEQMARHFLPVFLEGYSSEFLVDTFLLKEMDRFLKLREFSLYAVIHAHMDVDKIEDWYPQKFMKDRQQRIENEEPFINIDFERL